MGHNFSTYHPDKDPLANNAMVAPFLTDVDTRGTGSVFYRESRDRDLLERAGAQVRESGRSSNFMPTSLIIATWNGVGYYSGKSDKVLCIIITKNTVIATLYAIFGKLDLHNKVCGIQPW